MDISNRIQNPRKLNSTAAKTLVEQLKCLPEEKQYELIAFLTGLV